VVVDGHTQRTITNGCGDGKTALARFDRGLRLPQVSQAVAQVTTDEAEPTLVTQPRGEHFRLA
jgi:hypothetical protein